MQEILTGIVFGSFAVTLCGFLALQIIWNGAVRKNFSVILFLVMGIIWGSLAVQLRMDQLNQRMIPLQHEYIAIIMVLQGWTSLFITLKQANFISETNKFRILSTLVSLGILSASVILLFPIFSEPPYYNDKGKLSHSFTSVGIGLNLCMVLIYFFSFAISIAKRETRAGFLIPTNSILLFAIITPLFPILSFPPRVTWMAIAAFFLTYAISQKDLLLEQNLAREELKQNLEKVKTEKKSMSKFLAMMSHEIRTPLGGISGLISLLGETRLSPDQKVFVDNLKNSSTSLNMLLNNILDYSKLEEGQMQLDEVEFDLPSLVEETFDMVFAQAVSKNLHLIHTVEIPSPNFYIADVTKIRQILLNLLTNSIKFSSNGSIYVISKEVEISGNKFLELTVCDQGIGMTQATIEKIFNDYIQADSGIASQFGGTGLGLAICKKLTLLMGGDICVKSELGNGSRFTFRFKTKVTQKKVSLTLNFQGRKAIVIGEDATNDFLINTLSDLNIQTTFFSNPMEALSAWKDSEINNPDYIFISYETPIINGLKLLTILFTQRQPEKSKIIVLKNTLSGIDTNEEIQISAVINRPIRQGNIKSNLYKIEQNVNNLSESEREEQREKIQRSVLLVEDNEINQMIFKRSLEKLGFIVTIAENGQIAIDKSNHEKFDLILMDIHMPVMDGYTASRQIRSEMNQNNKTPIFILSAEIELELANSLESFGLNGFIPKTFSPSDLRKAIERMETNKGAI